MANQTGLAIAMREGVDKVPDSKIKKVADAAVSRLKTVQNAAARAKERIDDVAETGVALVEIEGSVFLCSMAEGYWGREVLEVAGVDVRLVAGALGAGYGVYQEATGGNGSHLCAFSSGVLASFLASKGRELGERLKVQKSAPAVTAPAGPAGPGMHGLPPALLTPGIAGPMREVLLTPAPAATELAGRRERVHERRQSLRPAVRMQDVEAQEAA